MRRFFRNLLLGLALLTPAVAESAIFQDGFDSRDCNWSGNIGPCIEVNSGVIAVVQDFFRSGTGSIHFFFDYPQVGSCESTSPVYTGQCGGFTDYTYSPATTEGYDRFWVYLGNNFVPGVNAATKLLHTSTGVAFSTWLNVGTGPGVGQPNPTLLVFNPQNTNASGTTWNHFASGSGVIPKGQWVCVEQHIRLNTAGSNNGLVQVWMNDTLVIQSGDSVTVGSFNSGGVPANQYRAAGDTSSMILSRIIRQNGTGDMWFDDYAHDTARIGCGGTPPPPPPPPPPPTSGYWDENFTNGLTSWDISGCQNGGNPPGDPFFGCNPGISSAKFVSSPYSLKSTFHPSDPSIQQGTYYNRSFTPTNSLWTRQWIRLEGPSGVGPFVIDTTGTKHTIVYSGGPGYGVWLVNKFSSKQLSLELVNSPTIDATRSVSTSFTFNDYQWYCLETFTSIGTPGTPTGVVQLYVDGVLHANVTDAVVPTDTVCPVGSSCQGQTLTRDFRHVRHFAQYGSGDRYMDDIAVGTSRIGCAPNPSPDTIPPSQVTGLQATASNGQVQLQWAAATDNVAIGVYNIQRATNAAGPWTGIVQANALAYNNTGLTNGTTYYYRVAAQDTAGNVGPFSSVVSATPVALSGSATVLTLSGDGKFRINGVSTFLLGMTIYDGPNWHSSDIDYLDGKLFNLIVIHADDVLRNNTNSLYNADGSLKSAKQTAIEALIDYADSKGMIVDINCLYADVDGSNSAAWLTTPTARTNAVTNCVNAFKANGNVLFSIVNEHNYGSFADTHAEVAALVATARAACPTCILTFSSSDNFGTNSDAHLFTTRDGAVVDTSNVLAEVNSDINVIMPHNDRGTGWNLLTTARAGNLRAYLDSIGRANIPVFFEEDAFPDNNNNPTVGTFSGQGALASYLNWITVAQDCKAAGCAGWVMNSAASFALSGSSLISMLEVLELQVVDNIGAALLTPSSGGTVRDTATVTDNFNRAASGSSAAAIGDKDQVATASGTTKTTPAMTTTTGSTLAACMVWDDSATFVSLTDSMANTWTQIGSEGTGASGSRFRMYYAQNIASNAAHTVSLVVSGSAAGNLQVVELKGVLSSGVLDQTNAQQDNTTPYISGGVTTTTADQILVACGAANTDAGTATHTAGASFTLQQEITDATQYWISHLSTRIVTATGTYDSSTTMAGPTVNSTYQRVASFKASTSTGLGANYLSGYTDTAGHTINASTVVRGTSTTLDNMSVYNATLPNNQWSSIQLGTAWTGSTVMVARALVRAQDAPTFSTYACTAAKNWFGTSITVLIEKFIAGTYSILLGEVGGPTWAAGDTLSCEVSGTTITAYRTPSGGSIGAVGSVTDTTFTSGKCGILTYVDTLANLEVDNLNCGGFTTPVPITTPTITSLVLNGESGFTFTYTGSLASFHFWHDAPDTSLIRALSLAPGGVYSYSGYSLASFLCVGAIDPNGSENTNPAAYVCVPHTPIITDTTAPVLVTKSPPADAIYNAGTTSVPGTAETNEPSICKWDTTNIAYGSMTNTMDDATPTSHSTAFGSLSDNTAYTRYGNCADLLGNTMSSNFTWTFSVAAAPPTDTTAPSTVTNFSGVISSTNQINWQWDAASDASGIRQYEFYLCGADPTCASPLLVASPMNNAYQATGLAPATLYIAAVKAVDNFGNVSAALSNIFSVLTPTVPTVDIIPPSQVTTFVLNATPLYNSVVLGWDLGTDTGTGIVRTTIERAIGPTCTDYKVLGSAGTGILTFTDSTVMYNTEYCYRAKHVDNAGNVSDEYSDPLEVSVPDLPEGTAAGTVIIRRGPR